MISRIDIQEKFYHLEVIFRNNSILSYYHCYLLLSAMMYYCKLYQFSVWAALLLIKKIDNNLIIYISNCEAYASKITHC